MFKLFSLLLIYIHISASADYDNITGKGVLETLIEDIIKLNNQLKTRYDDLNNKFEKEIKILNERIDDLYADVKHDNWHLGMNLNPADGHIMSYETGWHTGESIGSKHTAFT